MRESYLTNLPLEEAVHGYLSFLQDAGLCPRTETVAVSDAFTRITASAVRAVLCSPHYTACAMDGIAVNSRLTFSANEAVPVRLSPGQYIPVDTGDPLPEHTDAVVMIEDCIESDDGTIRLLSPAAPWQHVRQIGEDISAGDMLLPSYTKIDAAALGALLAGGISSVSVLKKPVVGILPTGDEVVPPSDHPAPGDVMEFNSAIFSAMLQGWGAAVRTLPIVPDDPVLMKAALERAVSECDMVLIGAGTSAGRDDGTANAIRTLGEVFCHGIAIRPGKPAVLGRVGQVPVIGVPGYPVSGIIVLEKLVQPVVNALLRQPTSSENTVHVRLGKRIHSSLKYREFIRAGLSVGKDGVFSALPLNRGAGVITSFVKADCILDIPQNSEGLDAGATVSAKLIRSCDTLQNTLRITGSHDPLLDEAGDLLRRHDPSKRVCSLHVGSMGAILAVSRGEAPLGGIHLLDGSNGDYNVSYIEKYFPDGGVALIECVNRVQGLMCAPGNPKKIGAFCDIARPGIRYVNRQPGAGTRLLCDYLLQQNGIAASDVDGYRREELTHTAVAAQIAANSANCGLGILSAARMYGLDFIPICNEQYDLLAAEASLDEPAVQAFLQVLQSPDFLARLTAMGGYRWEQPGRIRKLWKKKT